MLGRQRESRLIPSLLLAVVFPSGLILANTRATLEAFFSNRMDFVRTMRPGEIQKGGWRGVPELVAGVFVAALCLCGMQLGGAVLLLRGVGPGFHRHHGRHRAPACPPADQRGE